MFFLLPNRFSPLFPKLFTRLCLEQTSELKNQLQSKTFPRVPSGGASMYYSIASTWCRHSWKRQTTWDQSFPDLKSWIFGTRHWLVYIKCWTHRCWEKVLPQGGNHTSGNRKNLGTSWTLSWFHEISTLYFLFFIFWSEAMKMFTKVYWGEICEKCNF